MQESANPFYAASMMIPFKKLRFLSRKTSCIRLALTLFAFFCIKRILYDSNPIPEIEMKGVSVKEQIRNSSCIILSCSTYQTIGLKEFWNYYSKMPYTVSMTLFEHISHEGEAINPVWCRIPSVLNALKRNRNSRVLYLDIDSKVDPIEWCNLPNSELAPIVMNSYTRGRIYAFKDYKLQGTQVQANSFIVRSGKDGIRAMERWKSQYYNGQYQEQGAIHMQEKGLCGVPGWIACYSNLNQQKCHCPAIKDRHLKAKCIRDLFSGKKKDCPI